ncbi:28S ribosomal protein S31, mitochondrial [Takifugu flavidus]|uniref:Small ribosomal subunit protein mS31 n=2 Tax=Takifugu flavidus TaxID=433684 RepID=A0A5C6P7T4_9TELE|nr:28S ribosomal protein S31, mitochondrial [Takifugu flavidus]
MYRYLLRTLRIAKKYPLESSELLSKFDKGQVCWFADEVGVRSLCTTSVKLCEKQSGVASSSQNDIPNGNGEREPTETPLSNEQKVEVASKGIIMAEESKDNGIRTQSQPTVITEQHTQVKAKSGKESLLDLLGGMKVEVTNKRKVKGVKFRQSPQSIPMSKPAAMESTISMFQQAKGEASTESKTLDPELVTAASAAASTLPNSSQVESELLRKLRQHESITESQRKGDTQKLGGLIADMKVGKRTNRQKSWATNPIRFDDDGRGYTQDRSITGELEGIRRRKSFHSGKRLNIFSPATSEEAELAPARPTLWDVEFANQLSVSINHQARNGLEEMIQWTKEGKLWKYPINNEDGLEEEASVSFYEHVFLEKHLEEGFPRQGPVRHFMELVVVGLSKNPYLTVQQKKDHIFWFRDYFSEKQEILKGADVYLN